MEAVWFGMGLIGGVLLTVIANALYIYFTLVCPPCRDGDEGERIICMKDKKE